MTKNILIITDNLKTQINGVVTTYKNIENCANQVGYNFSYITPEDFTHFDMPLYNEIKLSFPSGLSKKIKYFDPDYIHIATEGPLGVATRLLLSWKNIKYTSAYHTKLPEAIKSYIKIPEFISWRFIHWFHKKSTKVLTTTPSMVETLNFRGLNNAKAWTRGVDRNIFKQCKIESEFKNPVLLCVSRVSKEKNLEDFFELDFPQATKIMVGDGPKLYEYRKKYPNVIFVGFKQGEELARYYQMATVFVFPSRWDTFGLVMIEAMACGTPVAAFPVQGPIDVIIPEKTGIMNTDLKKAVEACIQLDREKVYLNSQNWSWELAWEIFKENLIIVKN
jgi:glycosyltransferase involved in cell wall biosynthesis